MIIILNGAPGAGKTFLLSSLSKFKEYSFVPVKKYTNRFPRNFEKNKESFDLHYGCSKEDIESLDYHYIAKDKLYGIDKKEIQSILNNNGIPVIIIRSFEIIRKIKSDFNDVYVMFVIGATGETLRGKLSDQGRSQKELSNSDFNFQNITEDYINNIKDIDYCLINSLYNEETYFKQFITFAKINMKEV